MSGFDFPFHLIISKMERLPGADVKFLASSASQCNMVAVDKRACQDFIDLS